MLEDAVAEAVPAHVAVDAGRGERRRRPEPSGLLVPDVEGLARGVAHRVVVPGRQPELVGVLDPGIGAPAFADDGADLGAGDDVGPRRPCGLTGLERNDVFAAVRREAAQPVAEDALPGREGHRTL